MVEFHLALIDYINAETRHSVKEIELEFSSIGF